jgi:hypothetical protein
MTQGARTTARDDVEDLDVLITSRSLKPKRVKLFDRTWTIKRDFSPAEIAQYWVHIDKGGTVDAMKMLVGVKDGADMAGLVSAIPTEMLTQPMRRIYQIAGLIRRTDDAEESEQGESEAS